MTDEDAISELVSHVPGAIVNRTVTAQADAVRPVIREAILFERARASACAKRVREDAVAMVKQAQQARDERMAISCDSAARTAHGIAGLIMQAPGACGTCNGTRLVPSTLAPGMNVPCMDCPPPKEAEPPREVA
jgi:predicted cobalt transporter CbtA